MGRCRVRTGVESARLKCPPFDWEDDLRPSTYFKALKETIAKQEGWELFPDKIVLGFFSFAKFLMYRDLDPENWPGERSLDEHEILKGLVGEGFPAPEPAIPDDSNLDELVSVERLNHVVDSDSSQAIAIEEVRSNRNLVIQGPPGTGKSQTITNLIATAVLDGKRVLFVAEKMAALDVVKRRLEDYGLGPLVLELHSHKSNKRTVLEELKKTIGLRRPKNNGSEQLLKRLNEHRRKLNEHSELHNTPIQPGEMTPIQIIGQLSLLGEDEDPTRLPHLKSAEKWTPEDRIEREKMIADVASRVEEMGNPSNHPWRGVKRTVLTMFDAEKVRAAISKLSADLLELQKKCANLAREMRIPPPPDIGEIGYYLELAEHVEKAPELDKNAIVSSKWEGAESLLTELVNSGREVARIRSSYSERFIDAAWVTELTPMRMEIAAHGKSIFRFLNSGFRKAMENYRALLKVPKPPKNIQERLHWLDEITAAQKHEKKLSESKELLSGCLGELYEGEKSNWGKIADLLAWVASVKEARHGIEFFQMFSLIEDPKQCGHLSREVESLRDKVIDRFSHLIEVLSLDLEHAFNEPSLLKVALNQLIESLEVWDGKHDDLHNWVTFQHLLDRAEQLGLAGISKGILDGKFSGSEANAIFQRSYYRQLFKLALETVPNLANFDGHSHDLLVREFKDADLRRIKIARWETLLKHHGNLPSEGGMGAVGILKGEMNKKRGHMAIRKLLAKTGTAAQSIKPVFMMSPLSVAQFLEPGTIDFDLVIFDEASQIEPVDALGAIARANQVVVVGDDKQLPPTRFFARFSTDDVYEEDDDDEIVSAGDLESILGLAMARGFHSKMLRWHYRSRHQSLIAVSNHEFYHDNLFIIPSPHNNESGMGLMFHFVENGTFDRGKSKTNLREARTVAEAVIKHAIDHPKKSLGVAAFSVSQRDAITDELELLRKNHPEAEFFFREHHYEPFFVKNLENVQGDERDVILISVGYAKDSSGFFAMNFGPLNRDGGERRLNVLITRAKERCEVYTSIRADEIDLSRSKSRGVSALKTFLEFAEKGILGIPDPKTDRDMDSPFEESVKRALEAEGYTVHPQVGSSGFFIDLAVLDAEKPGRYALGIECDGASYHSARSARERDRQRQAVLEDHGWIIHRIWSTDWFNRPNEELKRVKKAIEDARTSEGVMSHHTDQELAVNVIEREEQGDDDPEEGFKGELYIEADFKVDTRAQIHEEDRSRLAKYVLRVVEIESPIHKDEVVSRIRECWGLKRAGSRIRDAVYQAIDLLIHQKHIRISGEFAEIPDSGTMIRDRSNVNSPTLKKPEYLPPTEIRLAITKLLELNHGVAEEIVAFGVGRLLGFGATSQQLRAVVEKELAVLKKDEQVYTDGSYLKVKG